MFDSGLRSSLKTQRQAALERHAGDPRRRHHAGLVGGARGARGSGERRARRWRARGPPPTRRSRSLDIVNVSFRAGAATNIEVIDAERIARDTDTAVAVAEDILRRARLDLLLALGRFP